jgi:hypothetical protein
MIASQFNDWRRLRKLTLAITTPHAWPWDVSDGGPLHPRMFLENAHPPIRDGETSLNVAEVAKHVSLDEVEKLRLAVRQILPAVDAQDLPDDQLQLMTAWGARHEVKVAREVRRLAEKLPSLEEFEWYPGGPHQSALWKWKISRVKLDSERKVSVVRGNLSWDGCATGDPPEFASLVGQELAYYEDRYDRGPWKDVSV